jgi:hypothetical protein
MQQLVYALQFQGRATPTDASAQVLTADTRAGPCQIVTPADRGGSVWLEVGEARFDSEVRFSAQDAFTEKGVISFGEDDRLYFDTIGSGHIGHSLDPERKHGSVIWRIERGEGRFADASGLITSNFTVGAAGEVLDCQFAMIFLP